MSHRTELEDEFVEITGKENTGSCQSGTGKTENVRPTNKVKNAGLLEHKAGIAMELWEDEYISKFEHRLIKVELQTGIKKSNVVRFRREIRSFVSHGRNCQQSQHVCKIARISTFT